MNELPIKLFKWYMGCGHPSQGIPTNGLMAIPHFDHGTYEQETNQQIRLLKQTDHRLLYWFCVPWEKTKQIKAVFLKTSETTNVTDGPVVKPCFDLRQAWWWLGSPNLLTSSDPHFFLNPSNMEDLFGAHWWVTWFARPETYMNLINSQSDSLINFKSAITLLAITDLFQRLRETCSIYVLLLHPTLSHINLAISGDSCTQELSLLPQISTTQSIVVTQLHACLPQIHLQLGPWTSMDRGKIVGHGAILATKTETW